MIVGQDFPGDTNEALKWIQHDLYKELLPELVRLPRRRYLRAAQLVGVQDETTSALKTLETFDHRVLQANTSEGYTAEETLSALLAEEYDFTPPPPWLLMDQKELPALINRADLDRLEQSILAQAFKGKL